MKSPVIAGHPRRWWVVALSLLLIGAGCFGLGLRNPRHPLAGPPATAGTPRHLAAPVTAASKSASAAPSPSTPGSVATHRARATNVPVARSKPIALRIPAIGVSVSLSTLGLNPDRTVQVPTDFQQAGWFQPGPAPGQDGSAVILGHVDSFRGPAVFFRIRSLRKGDPVDVQLADGVVAHFAVRTVVMYSKTQFPARQVYGSHGGSALQLVTCGGTFDASTGHYLSNVVAYTSLVGTTPAAKHR